MITENEIDNTQSRVRGDLRGLVRDSRLPGRIVAVVEDMYKDMSIDYEGARDCLLADKPFHVAQQETAMRGGGARHIMDTKTPEQREQENRQYEERVRRAYTPSPARALALSHESSGAPATPAPPSRPRSRPRTGGTRECLCGCGATVRSRFLPGHDAKLKSRGLRVQKGKEDSEFTDEQIEWLKERGIHAVS